MEDKKRSPPPFPPVNKTVEDHVPKRARLSTSPSKKQATPPSDAETELLRALEEEVAKEEEKKTQDQNKKLPQEEEEDDDYDESDDE
ncbi:hypothetical protein ON010_g1141 [Phytophthora cinnamomi]|nr:hypothetical protein ON010_g1141 [Phytophthora cinnamomi]